MKDASGLSFRECKREYSISPIRVCEFCFGPAEVFCDYGKIKKDLTVRKFDERPKSMKEEEMEVHVRIPAPLKKLAEERDVIKAQGRTVGEVLQWLTETYPGLKERLRDEQGRVRRFINIYVNDEDIRFIQNLETPLKEGDQISIVPAIAGGSSLKRGVTPTFPPKLIKEPVIHDIGRRFKLVTKIRSANVSENVGWVTLEIDGEETEYSKALDYLNKIGVIVEPVERNIIE
jgi:molybdopterin synthase sulfur carrier subunit